MNTRQRSRLAAGLLLILVGAWFLYLQVNPAMSERFYAMFDWPVYLIGGGALLLIFGLLAGASGMAVPASIVAGVGLILYYQNLTQNWASWSYAWTLILGFIGVGVLLDGLLSGRPRHGLKDGISMLLISAALFLIFSTLTGGPISLGDYWPVLIIVWGLWVIIRAILRPGRSNLSIDS
jgi:hypothetical protein